MRQCSLPDSIDMFCLTFVFILCRSRRHEQPLLLQAIQAVSTSHGPAVRSSRPVLFLHLQHHHNCPTAPRHGPQSGTLEEFDRGTMVERSNQLSSPWYELLVKPSVHALVASCVESGPLHCTSCVHLCNSFRRHRIANPVQNIQASQWPIAPVRRFEAS